jgi:hypothetical protein
MTIVAVSRPVAAVCLAAAATVLAAAPSGAAGARCGGQPVAMGLVAAPVPRDPDRPMRLVVPLEGRPTAASDAPTGVVLGGLALPASADPAIRAAVLARLDALAGRPVVVFGRDGRRDRRGRVTGQVVVRDADGHARWLQADLAAAGLALAGSGGGGCAAALLRAETAAREAGAGLFAGRGPAIGATEPGRHDLPDFVLVEGVVASVGISGGTTYLNFGPDRRTDVTVRVVRRDSDDFEGYGQASRLAGSRIRVRGWAFDRDGPDIGPVGFEAIEVVGDGGVPAKEHGDDGG